MQASNGETKGLGVTVGKGRPSLEKGEAEKLATRHHTLARGGSRKEEIMCVGDLLPEMFPPMSRSGLGDSKSGIASQKQHSRKFF